MPTYRSITIALHSQFDIETIPEYTFPPAPPIPHEYPPSSKLPPTASHAHNSTITTHAPSLPGSRFWLSYAVAPPVPPEWYFLFKLYIDGAQVVSWCTGKEEGWSGKVMFGLFEGERGCERRVFCFGEKGEEAEVVVQVFRAAGRKRVARCREGKGEGSEETGGVRLVSAGRAGREQPKRFYKLALIDPVDQPLATFRYRCCPWERLRELGLLDGENWAGSEDGLPVIEPENYIDIVNEDPDRLHGDGCDTAFHDWNEAHGGGQANTSTHAFKRTPGTAISPRRTSIASGSYVPRGAPTHNNGSPPSRRRLSIPPSITFAASDPPSRPLPLPQKDTFPSSTAYRPHPAYPVEEWTVPAPSPVGSAREGGDMPLLGRKRGLGLGLGLGVAAVLGLSWKRSASGSAAPAGEKEEKKGGEGARSVSC